MKARTILLLLVFFCFSDSISAQTGEDKKPADPAFSLKVVKEKSFWDSYIDAIDPNISKKRFSSDFIYSQTFAMVRLKPTNYFKSFIGHTNLNSLDSIFFSSFSQKRNLKIEYSVSLSDWGRYVNNYAIYSLIPLNFSHW